MWSGWSGGDARESRWGCEWWDGKTIGLLVCFKTPIAYANTHSAFLRFSPSIRVKALSRVAVKQKLLIRPHFRSSICCVAIERLIPPAVFLFPNPEGNH